MLGTTLIWVAALWGEISALVDGGYVAKRRIINIDEIGVSALMIWSGLSVGHWTTWFRLKGDFAFALFHMLVIL